MKNPAAASLWRRLAGVLGLIVVFVLLNGFVASWLLWRNYDRLADHVATAQWPIVEGSVEIEARKISKEQSIRILFSRDGDLMNMDVTIPGQDISPLRLWEEESSLHLAAPEKGSHFFAEEADLSSIHSALRESAAALPDRNWARRLLASLALRPFLTGVQICDGKLCWKLTMTHGELWLDGSVVPREANLNVGDWQLRLLKSSRPSPSMEKIMPPGQEVPGNEFSASLAEIVRVLALPLTPAPVEADTVRRSGKGWLEIRQGHRQMYLEGSPYELGHQHGSLAPENIRRISHRLVYGVGLLYSLKQAKWFPEAVREVVERQRPFIPEAYFEEMKGLADGAGLPLALVQATNIYPEFFHCSGAALMGTATIGGELLHARVLDYMVGIGLQDEAVVVAVTGHGVNPFVNVSYLGFVGSVTGMNDQQVAIGEMGGDGVGDWDGMPMCLLIRQALETCDTLEEVEALMRKSPRTCEYYYLISDGKGPSALGVAATPKKFETFGVGEWHEMLAQPLTDTVLLSGKGRYEKLVERVKAQHGNIDRETLIEIIKAPVSMKSNLHDVIFQPQSLRISVADAVRGGLACDQPYRTYTWPELFSAVPSP